MISNYVFNTSGEAAEFASDAVDEWSGPVESVVRDGFTVLVLAPPSTIAALDRLRDWYMEAA